MKLQDLLLNDIKKQLDEQGISYELLSEKELDIIDRKWRDKFIGSKIAPWLDKFKWHIFSFNQTSALTGNEATKEYAKQFPTELFIFNEKLQFGLKCFKSAMLPVLNLHGHSVDMYISQKNMKWTYVITHESPPLGPYFSS